MGVFRRTGRRVFGIAGATAVILGVVVPFTTGVAGASASASISQCRNGALGSPNACDNAAGTYQNGDLNATNSHFREGDFVPYNVTLAGLGVGQHDLNFGYRVGDSGKHALDYLGNFDQTETTSSTAGPLFANNNNPCDGLTLATPCTPSSPTSSFPVPAPDFAGMDAACSTSGTFAGPMVPGAIKLFGAPTGSTLDSFTYSSQNVSSASGCVTNVDLKFTLSAALTGGQNIVLAWGGHIASQEDWGPGNSASFISGSPYHMFLNSLDGASAGGQDRQMKTTAVFFTPSVSTTIINNGTSAALTGPINIGTTVHDTATLTQASATAGGTITFTLRSNVTDTTACTGTTVGTPQVVTISPAGAANSPGSVSSANFTPTLGGTYAYQAVYSGDGSDVPGNFTSACEPFTVQGNTPTLSTTAQVSTDNTTFSNITGTIAIGNFVRDTSALAGTASPVAGSVKYTLYTGTGCSSNAPTGTQVFTNTQTVTSATPPASTSTQLLTAGTYQWQAVFTSSNNQNTGATSACGSETFTVGPNSPTLSTQAQSSSSSSSGFTNITGSIAIGSFVRDTASLSGAATPTTGSVLYTLYTGTGCTGNAPTGTSVFTNTQTLASNAIPPSASTQLLTAGSYQWQAVYTSGNGQNTNATSPCGSETFTVAPNAPTLATQAQSSSNNVTFTNITGSLTIGTFVRDTATLTGAATPTTGSVVYNLYPGMGCTNNTPNGTAVFTDSENLASNTIPPSASTQLNTAGTYQWQAVYTSGNGQNLGATSPCGSEIFTVGPNTPTLSTQAQSSSNNVTFTNITGTVPIGTFVRDTATLSGAATPTTGSVLYSLYPGTSCTGNTPNGTALFTDTENLASNAIPASLSTQLNTAGTYQWQAVYTSGNGQNVGATSACGSEPFTVGPNNPTLSTTAQSSSNNVTFTNISGPIAIGDFVRDTATLNGAAVPTTGSVLYTLYNGTSCTGNTPSGTSVFTDVENLASNAIPPSLSTQLLTAGAYQWQAVYTTGNGQNSDATSACGSETFTVAPNSPTLSTQAQSSSSSSSGFTNITGPIVIGSFVRDTATLNGAATPTTGSVVYTLYNGTTCTGNTPNGTSVFTDTEALASNAIPPSAPTQLLTAGTYQWQAVYTSGNGQNNNATSPCGSEPLTVAPNSPTLSTQAQSSSSSSSGFTNITGSIAIGSFVRDTATLNGAATPTTGSVLYTLYTGTSCDGNSPTGTSVFTDTEALASNAIPPSASKQLLTAGSYQWQAVYTSGNGQNNNATSACGSETFTVAPNSPSLSTTAQESSDNTTFNDVTGPVVIGTFVRDTASLTGAATPTTGSVVYTLYTGTTCSENTPTGTSVFTDTEALASNAIPDSKSTQLLTAGTYQWQAVYTSGNGQNNNATSPCGSEPLTVAPNGPTLSTQAQSSSSSDSGFTDITGPIAIGSFVRDTSTLHGAATPTTGSVAYTLYSGTTCDGNTPTGSVVFSDTEPLVSNATQPSASTQLLTAGSYQWRAVYTSGNGQNLDATSPCGSETFTVQPNSPTLSTTAQSSTDNVTFSDMTGSVVIGTFVRDTATLIGAATPTTGSVVYTLTTGTACDGNDPTGTVVLTDTENLANNAIPPSTSIQLNTAGTYQWQAVYTSSNGQNNNATSPCGSEAFTVTTPNFTILKTDVPGNTLPVTPGSTIPYTVTIQNVGDGPGTATIEDVLPSSITMTGAPTCTVTNSGTDSCTVPTTAVTTLDATITLASGDTATIKFNAVLAATDTADVVNTATIKTGVCDTTQGTTAPSIKGHAVTIQCSSTVTNPVPDFTVTKTDVPGDGQSVTAGSTIPYTVAIKNVGDGAGSATITDTLPSSLTVQGTPTCAVTAPDTCKVTNTTGSTWTFDVTLAVGDTATVTFSAVVAATASGTITNTATITTGPCNTSSGCASTVSNPIPPVTAPLVTTTTTTAPPKAAVIAFTGADIAAMAAGGLVLIGLGGFLLLLSRRRRQAGETG